MAYFYMFLSRHRLTQCQVQCIDINDSTRMLMNRTGDLDLDKLNSGRSESQLEILQSRLFQFLRLSALVRTNFM